jgi:hypothetical protein
MISESMKKEIDGLTKEQQIAEYVKLSILDTDYFVDGGLFDYFARVLADLFNKDLKEGFDDQEKRAISFAIHLFESKYSKYNLARDRIKKRREYISSIIDCSFLNHIIFDEQRLIDKKIRPF